MNWDKINEQTFAVKILKAHLEHGRLASTYLVTGKKDSGKDDIAEAFASALHCAAKKSFVECTCVNCSRVAGRNHPDVRWLGESSSKSIKIEEVRDIINWASLKPYEGKWKILILADADRLTLEASNAFLKTLEEPPEHTIFLLLVESKAQMLETIQSRSFEIRLKPLGGEGQGQENLLPIGIGQENWEDYLDHFQSTPREELKKVMDALMRFFRQSLASDEARSDSFLKAIDTVYECKDALNSNANQKLVLSRLAMQLRKILPKQTSSV